jgi:DNA-binding NarL/FixJ family response regulator
MPGANTIRLAIVEDDPGTRQELTALFQDEPDIRSVGEFPGLRAALDGLPRLTPDIVIVDHYLPDGTGVECVRRLRPLMPTCEFMMLTIGEEQALIFDALKAGATGYVLKGEPAGRIREAVRELAAGGSPMSASIARKVIRDFQRAPEAKDAAQPLSIREQEILGRLATGLRYKEIAAELGLSVHTIRTHIHNIYEKLQVHSKSGAIRSFNRHRDPAA